MYAIDYQSRNYEHCCYRQPLVDIANGPRHWSPIKIFAPLSINIIKINTTPYIFFGNRYYVKVVVWLICVLISKSLLRVTMARVIYFLSALLCLTMPLFCTAFDGGGKYVANCIACSPANARLMCLDCCVIIRILHRFHEIAISSHSYRWLHTIPSGLGLIAGRRRCKNVHQRHRARSSWIWVQRVIYYTSVSGFLCEVWVRVFTPGFTLSLLNCMRISSSPVRYPGH